MISFVDPIGNTFLMPCMDSAHNIHGTNVYENELKHHMLKGLKREREADEGDNDFHEFLDLQAEARRLSALPTTLQERMRVSHDPTETERFEATVEAYKTVRTIVEREVEKYRALDFQPSLIEAILQWPAIKDYALPVCFVPVDKDLSSIIAE